MFDKLNRLTKKHQQQLLGQRIHFNGISQMRPPVQRKKNQYRHVIVFPSCTLNLTEAIIYIYRVARGHLLFLQTIKRWGFIKRIMTNNTLQKQHVKK